MLGRPPFYASCYVELPDVSKLDDCVLHGLRYGLLVLQVSFMFIKETNDAFEIEVWAQGLSSF